MDSLRPRSGARRLLAAVCMTVLALAAFAAAARDANAAPPKGFFGVDTAVTPTAPAFAQMATNGAEVFRIAAQWPEIEPVAPVEVGGQLVHSYRWTRTDAEMRMLLQAGLIPHVTLIGSPSWVAKSYATTPMRSKAGRRSWPAYAKAVAERYGPGGAFWAANPTLPRRFPDTYQVWNEPNSQIALAPKADPVEYAALYKLAAKQIRAAAPAAKVVPAGMFGTPQLNKSMYAWDFLDRFLRVPKIGRYVDGIAVHPYAKGLRGVKYQIRKMRKSAHGAGFGKLPLYVTEIGWSSEKPNGNIFFKGPEGQAKAVDRALGLLVKNQKRWKIRRVLWFTWSDLTQHQTDVSGCGFCKETGLVDVHLEPKAALKSWRRWALR